MSVPTEDDWRSEVWDQDTPWAYAQFHGKTADEAAEHFGEGISHEYLASMPSRVFGYYFKAFITYLMSDVARDDSCSASWFISLVRLRSEQNRHEIVALWPDIEPMLKKLAEEQDYFGADWVIYGSFRSQIHEIVQRGFPVSFDTAIPDAVPESVSVRDMASTQRPIPWPVAVQIFNNSGVAELDVASSKPDVLRVFGQPDKAGGGDHPEYGFIPDWIRYDQPHCFIRFEFDGEVISHVMFMTPMVCDEAQIAELKKRADAFRRWSALFDAVPQDEGS